MLKAEEQMEIAVLKRHGECIRSLSRPTGRSRNTVRRYLWEADAAATRKTAPKRPEKLGTYKVYIVERKDVPTLSDADTRDRWRRQNKR